MTATVTVTVHAATPADSASRAQAIADLITAEFGQGTRLEVTVGGPTEVVTRTARANGTAPTVGAQIAYRIRAELVCCHLYGRVNDTHELTLRQAMDRPGWHDLCYWGEAAARLAESYKPAAANPDQETP